MGEDLIYLVKKGIPRMLVSIFAAIICFGVILVTFPSYVVLTGPWLLIGATFGSACLFIMIEYYKSTRIVQGYVENISVSDLTKSLFWLSSVNSGAAFSLGGMYNWRNVDKVAQQIGGKLQADWQRIKDEYKMPDPKSMYIIFILLMSGMLAVPASMFLLGDMGISVGAGVLVIAFVSMWATGKHTNTIRLLSDDLQARTVANRMTHEIITWMSTRAKEPIRFVLAEGTLADAEFVDSFFGYVVAVLKPKDFPSLTEEMNQLSIAQGMRKSQVNQILRLRRLQMILYVSIHLIVALAMGYFAVIALQRLVIGEIEVLSFILAGISIATLVGIQYFLYVYIPQMKVLLTGGKASPFDLYMIVKRGSRRQLKNLYLTDPDFRHKVSFVASISRDKSAEFSTLNQIIKLWIKEDARLPMRFRYFNIEHNAVTLTEKGLSLARAIAIKNGKNLDSGLSWLQSPDYSGKVY